MAGEEGWLPPEAAIFPHHHHAPDILNAIPGWGVDWGWIGSFQNVKWPNRRHRHLTLVLNKTGKTVQRNTVQRSRKQSWKIGSTCSEYVFIALVIQHAKRMRRIICLLWPGRLYHIIPHYFINGTIFRGKNYFVFIFLYKFVCNICHSKKNSARYYHQSKVQYRHSGQILVKVVFSRQIFEKQKFKYRQ